MSNISVRWDQRSLDGLAEKLKRFPGIWLAFLEDAGKISADQMRANAPVRTGALWSSIIIDVGPNSVRTYPTVPYAPFVEAGTRPHIIRPVNASVLHFFSGGQEIFAREVHHPGFQGRFFIRKTRDDVREQIADLARLYVMNLFEE